MAATAAKTILLKGDAMVKEAPAAAAITPGNLLMRTSAGKVQKHATAAGLTQKMFALEKDLLGYPDNTTIDSAYALDDQVAFAVCPAGCEVYALVPAAAAAIVIGDLLESDGTGCVRKVANAANALTLVGIAVEAVDNSGGGTVARLRIEVA